VVWVWRSSRCASMMFYKYQRLNVALPNYLQNVGTVPIVALLAIFFIQGSDYPFKTYIVQHLYSWISPAMHTFWL
jgi:hypothetical protein